MIAAFVRFFFIATEARKHGINLIKSLPMWQIINEEALRSIEFKKFLRTVNISIVIY